MPIMLQLSRRRDDHGWLESETCELRDILIVMSKTEETPLGTRRQFLTDENGKPTHVVRTVEAYERIADLIEEADDVLEVERRMKDAELASLEEVKASLGLHGSV